MKASSLWDGRDFALRSVGLSPPGYPGTPGHPGPDWPDAFVEEGPAWTGPEAWLEAYEARRAGFLGFTAARPAPPILKAPFFELPRALAGLPVHEGILGAGLDYIEDRKDCSDFLVHAYLRLLRDPRLARAVPASLLDRARDVLLSFKHWPDEPGKDSLCTWTENHQVLYASAAYILGRAWPDRVFGNSGRTGQEQAARALPRLLRWLDLRFRSGFSEWLSNVYYDEDLCALLSLVDFAGGDLGSRATSVADLLFLDLALHTSRGSFAPSHGRSYEVQKKDARNEAMSDTLKLAFGLGAFCRKDNMSAVCLALSVAYRPPEVLGAMAAARPEDAQGRGIEIRQRMGIRVDEAEAWGLGYRSLEDGLAFLSLEAYNHPRTINLTFRLLDAYGWWDNAYFSPFRRHRSLIALARGLGLLSPLARLLQRDLDRNSREEVDLYTYRTPDYSLSAAQDWKHRRGGDQQSIWQASLGPGATCFTTHPGGRGPNSPDWWTGSGSLPRVAQHRNLLFALYDIDTRPGLYRTERLLFTHAWLPEEEFDEVLGEGPWTFARRGRAYLALRAEGPVRRGRDDGLPGPPNELVREGKKTAWLCRLGREAEDGSFGAFRSSLLAARQAFDARGWHFEDPHLGLVEFGPSGPLLVDGREVAIHGYPRYASPWARADFPAREISLSCGGLDLVIDPCARRPR